MNTFFSKNIGILTILYYKDFYHLLVNHLPNILTTYKNPLFIQTQFYLHSFKYQLILFLFLFSTKLNIEMTYPSINYCIQNEKTFSINLFINSEFILFRKNIKISKTIFAEKLMELLKTKKTIKTIRKQNLCNYMFITYKELCNKQNLSLEQITILFLILIFRNSKYHSFKQIKLKYLHISQKYPFLLNTKSSLIKSYNIIQKYLTSLLPYKKNKLNLIYLLPLFIGCLPLLTTSGTFIINGLELIFIYKLTSYPGIFTSSISYKKIQNINIIEYKLILRSALDFFSEFCITKNLKTNLFNNLTLQFKSNSFLLKEKNFFSLSELLIFYDINFFNLIK